MSALLKIGVPVLNRGDLLRSLVASIDVEAEVLVILNRIGGADPSVEEAAGKLEARAGGMVRVRVERSAGNLGVAGSWNRIMDWAGGGCWLVNSDIAFQPGVLQEAMAQVKRRPEIVLHHLRSAACFYATAEFRATLGWFDENFYPAYHEDEEMALRCARLGGGQADLEGLRERVWHGGSLTLKNAERRQRQFIQEAQRAAGTYLRRRWGALPAPGELPAKRSPFDNPTWHPADWTLDLVARAELARRCEEITGAECPVVWHRARGGLG